MAVTATPVFPQTPKNGKVQIANADAQNQKTVYTGGANGSKIHGLILTSNDSSLAHDIQISITNGGTSFILGTVSVPINAGTVSGTPSVNGFAASALVGLPLDSDGNPEILLLSASDTLTVSAVVTVTSGKTVNVIAFGADF